MNTTEALLKAIKAEREGYGFYMMAAQSSSDEKGKKIFETLASEELDHMHFLKGQYDAIIKTGKPDPNLSLGARLDLGGSFPIFSDAIKSRLKGAHIEMSALAIGIQLELDAMNFYKTQAQDAADPGIKRFFGYFSRLGIRSLSRSPEPGNRPQGRLLVRIRFRALLILLYRKFAAAQNRNDSINYSANYAPDIRQHMGADCRNETFRS